MHDLPLISTIAAGFTAAWLLGLATQRLGLSPIVGYLMAGVLLGPSTPGFKGDVNIAHQLAELGVILLMFGVGLHFHLDDLLAVKWIAIPGAIVQSLVATLAGTFAFTEFGLSVTAAAVIGVAMSVASTVVLMRVLMDADMLHSPQGHAAVGWLLVEDLLTVALLVLIPVLGEGALTSNAGVSGVWRPLGMALLKLGFLIVILMTVGARIIPWVLVQVARLRSRELFTLTVLVFSIAIAAGSYALFGASMALGAFLAGMVVAQSPVSQQAAADALPMRDAFAVLFFISVGMLFDPGFLLEEPAMVLTALAIVLIAKPLAALGIVAVLGYSSRTAITAALGLAQIGEFSFIVADLARKHKLMNDEGYNVLVAAAIISITLNPLIFRRLDSIENWLKRRPRLWKLLNSRAERRALAVKSHEVEHVAKDERRAIIVGFGPVGRSVHQLLQEAGFSTVVIDLNLDTVLGLRAKGLQAVYGDAANESILAEAGMRHASHLVLTLPQSSSRPAVVMAARNLNPKARVLVRAHYLSESQDLEQAGATAAVFEEAEVAVALARLALADTGARRATVERKVRDLRLQLIVDHLSSITSERVREIMVPWNRVRRLSGAMTRKDVQLQIAQHRITRWPVTDPATGGVLGHIVAGELEADDSAEWRHLIRPLRAVRSDDKIDVVLQEMQTNGEAICVVEESGAPVGLLTLGNVLDYVLDNEATSLQVTALQQAVLSGGVVQNLSAGTLDQAAVEMLTTILGDSRHNLSELCDVVRTHAGNATIAEPSQLAIVAAECPQLDQPIAIFGRSADGLSTPVNGEPVHLVFLLLTQPGKADFQKDAIDQLKRVPVAKLQQAESVLDLLDAMQDERDR